MGGAGQGGGGRGAPERCADGEAVQTVSGGGVQLRRGSSGVIDECGEVLQLEGDQRGEEAAVDGGKEQLRGCSPEGGGRW
jgi:hypothetical protein